MNRANLAAVTTLLALALFPVPPYTGIETPACLVAVADDEALVPCGVLWGHPMWWHDTPFTDA